MQKYGKSIELGTSKHSLGIKRREVYQLQPPHKVGITVGSCIACMVTIGILTYIAQLAFHFWETSPLKLPPYHKDFEFNDHIKKSMNEKKSTMCLATDAVSFSWCSISGL